MINKKHCIRQQQLLGVSVIPYTVQLNRVSGDGYIGTDCSPWLSFHVYLKYKKEHNGIR